MTVLDVITVPNIILNQRCDEIQSFDQSLIELVDDMFDTMKVSNGIGLAAPQIGVMERLFICKFK